MVDVEPATHDDLGVDRPWLVIVWNDPVNLDELRHLRLPEVVRLLVRQGHPTHVGRASERPRRGRLGSARNAPSSMSPASTATACGRPWSTRVEPPRTPTRPRPHRPTGSTLSLSPVERALLSSIPAQLTEALAVVGESDEELPGGLRRLFPAAYPTDASAEANYVSLVRADLVEHHRDALAVLAATASATRLTDDEARGVARRAERPADRHAARRSGSPRR